MKKNQILITGGCGFIGVNLIDYLLKHNTELKIRVLDNLSVGSRRNLSQVCVFSENSFLSLPGETSNEVELVFGDIKDRHICLKCCEGTDTVIHLAANTGVAPSVENPRDDMEVNVNGLFNMLDASRQKNVKNFIFASSGAPVGEVEPPIHEEKVPRPVSPYGASKLAGEGYCSAYYRTFGLKTIALRFGNVYGPRSKHKSSVVANFIKQALDGGPLVIFGDGDQTRDFIYIDDLIQAIHLSVKSDLGGEVFQIATSKETTVNEIALVIKSIIESQTDKTVEIIYSKPRIGDVLRNYSDISKAEKMLGFSPQYTIEQGLEKTFDYFLTTLNTQDS